MTTAITGVSTLFRKWNGSAWVSLAEIKNISGPTMSRETIDATNFSSTGGYREFIAGFRDAGTVNFTMHFVRSDYEIMKTDFESDDLQNYEIVLPDDEKTSLEFQGLVTELPLDIPEQIVTCSVTIKISGQVTVNSGSNTVAPS